MKLFNKNIYIVGSKPQTDWRRVLALAVILAICVTIYGFIFYQKISKEVNVTISVPQDRVGDSKLELNKIIELYVGKKERFTKMLNELKK